MPYIGKPPVNGFHTTQVLSGDGSTVTFTLNHTVASESSLIVSDNAVILEPKEQYDLASGGTKITFASAPASGQRTYVHFLGQAVNTNLLDAEGAAFILDVDGDTSLTADTDDEIDIKVGGTDRSTIKATGFHNVDSVKFVAGADDDLEIYHDGTNSLIANKTGALKIATETSGIAITLGHTTSEVTIADNATVAGNLTVTGTLTQTGTQTFDGGIDVDNFNINGTTIALSSGDMLLDSAGDIILDADGADVIFKDAGTTIATHSNSSSDYVITTGVQDKDFVIKGDDGGAAITALTLDMSAAGAATFNSTVQATGLNIGGTAVTSTAAELNILDDATITTAELNLLDGGTSASSVTIVDADRIILNDNGTMKQVAVSALNTFTSSSVAASSISSGSSAVTLTTSSGNITIDAAANDSDIILKGTDGGADTTFLTIDGSAAGEATFNAGIVIADAGVIGSASDKDAIAIASDGVVTFSQNPVGTLATAAQGNVTSLGTLTALTVDDVAIDGKVITMTGSSSDTAVFTAAANGALSIVTTDDSAAAANIQITADGTAELAGTTVTLDSSGGITLDADGGTITFADAGSSLGTITSSGYSGTAAAATTVTVTDNESTNENNVITFVAGADSDGGTGLGLESDGNLTYNPSTGTLSATNLVVTGTQTITNSVTMNASNAVVFEGATADAHETTLTTIDATGDRTISLPNVSGTIPVLAAVSATAITSTPAELNILDGATVVVGEINALDLGDTAVGTAIASKAVILDSNKDYTGIRNLTISGEIDAATGDFSGAVDVAGATTTAAITASGIIKTDDTTAASTTTDGSLQTDGGLSVAGDAIIGDDLRLLSDSAILAFGANAEVTLTHIHNDGLLLNADMQLQFRDSAINIRSDADGDLDINADDEIELNSTLIDINGNVDISGTGLTTGVHTFTARDVHSGGITIANAGQIGSVGDADAIAIASNGVVTMTQIPVFSAGLNVSGGTIAGTLSTAAQGNITSLGTLTALTVDDITINGSSIADSGDFTIDCGGDIILDAAGGEIRLKDNTTATAVLGMSSSNFTLESQVSDKDIIFKGNDGGSSITALTIDMSAAGAATFNNDVTAFSDVRLKDNIETIPNALETVCAMRGVNFTRNDNNDQPGTGVVAQEMQEVFPVVVKENDDENNTLSVSYGNLVGVLIESIKELKAEIDQLKGE